MSEQQRYDGRVAVITGAGRGLGREFALLLASRGASVVVNDIGVSADRDRYKESDGVSADIAADAGRANVARLVVDEITDAGGTAFANTGDIADPTQARSIVDDAVQEFGRVDIVVNNAGVVITRPLTELTAADLWLTHSVHVLGATHVLRAALPRMREARYGRVLNIGSVEGGIIGSPGFEVYAAAKGALIALTRHVAHFGEPYGIAANAVLPGGRTRSAARSGRKRNDGVDRSAETVAPPVAWLCHEACTANGQVFAVSAANVRQVRSVLTTGYVRPDPGGLTVADIATHWAEITDRSSIRGLEPLAASTAMWSSDRLVAG